MFTLSPTLPVTLRLIFSSKSTADVLRLRSGNEGLSMFFSVAPNFNSAVPCVLIRTPPGPKIFSAGPKSKCISANENFSSPLAATFSASFLRKKASRSRRSLQRRYSSGVIKIGAFRYESPIFEPIRYTFSESSYSTCCLIFSGRRRSRADESRSATRTGAVFWIFQRACNSESGMVSSSTWNTGCALAAVFCFCVLSSCGGIASAVMLKRIVPIYAIRLKFKAT